MKFGISAWGNSWLNALHGADLTNRLPRGKSYANTGKVYDIQIDKNIVKSKVKGKYLDYYNTSIQFDSFTEKEKTIILETIKESPSILSALLNHELPPELYEILKQKGVEVFPTSVDDITCSCNCPDYAYICKHVAGLLYMISHEVDKDPFEVFKLQNCNLLELLDYEESSGNIKKTSDLFTNEDNIEEINDTTLDFSKIPDLLDNILNFLTDNPFFYEKDFKAVLSNVYKAMARYTKSVDNYERSDYNYNDVVIFKDFSYEKYKGKNDDEEAYEKWVEDRFLSKWGKPNQWENVTIDIDDDYNINQINTGFNTPFNQHADNKTLFYFFMELMDSPKNKYNTDIQYLNTLFEFSIELIKKHAIIPELFENDGTYYIRWIPALFDKNIQENINKLVINCPEKLITYNHEQIPKKDQIITAISLFIKGYLYHYLRYGSSNVVRKLYDNPVFKVFYCEGQRFEKFSQQGYEKLINQWLSKFILNSREYKLYLVITEEFSSYEVAIMVSIEDEAMQNINKAIENCKDINLKTQLLSDTYVINEVYPKINKSIHLNENLELDLEEFSDFFINILPLFEMLGITIILPKNLQKIFVPKLTLDIESTKNDKSYITFNDLTKFDWKIHIGKQEYTTEEFKNLSEQSRGLVKIANNYVLLNEDATKTLIKQIDKLPEKLNKHELMKAMLSGEYKEAEVNIDNNIKEMINNIKENKETTIPESVTAKLREYQKIGYSWLVQNINVGFGSILADDMGLGKTLQVLTAIQHFKDEGKLKKEKVLIVAPTSLLTNWQQEIEKFTPDLTSYIFHGTKRKFPKTEYEIYLTSYGIIRRDEEKFKKRKWFMMVVDEAQNIKNPNTQQTKAIKKIKSKHKIALSGTPVENRLSEYWSIFDYINKGYLTTLKQFRQNYILPIEKERNTETLDNFKQITQPFILRRLKSDKNVIKDLPDKITNDVYCNLTTQQVTLYKETLDHSMEEVDANKGMKRKGLVLKLINSLKQICNHPTQYTKIKKADIKDSGKMQVLINLLENIQENNEKVLIFTQYVQMGHIMQKLIEEQFKEEVLFLHGSLSRKKRDEMVEKFQTNTQCKIFIVSLKAGGTGLNLTAAQNVIHYDLWWNPAVENQATDRAYRIGQKENVMVYRFITKGTFEERINEMIQDKKELAEITVGNGEKFITEMNDEELKAILELRRT
ncbi:MAG: DEAD/DEAH box helicase [Methanosphaera sp.]|nr:DEAD/DEAH box helicase [Methanosphaera sp.]